MLRGKVADFRLTVANFYWKRLCAQNNFCPKFRHNECLVLEYIYRKIKQILQFKIQVGDISIVVGDNGQGRHFLDRQRQTSDKEETNAQTFNFNLKLQENRGI